MITAVRTLAAATVVIDSDVNGNPIYVGRAAVGSDQSAPVWQLRRISYAGTSPSAIEYANGSPELAFRWVDRASYAYA